MFPNLKLQIFRRGSHQNRLAKAVGIDETVLSKIIHGYRTPTASQRVVLANYLGADEAWLFERYEAVPTQSILDSGGLSVDKKAEKNGDL
jgi:transcriptional regulator with XRE-family HTH domain